jgi:hypothetical protein
MLSMPADTFSRIADHKITRIDELLPGVTLHPQRNRRTRHNDRAHSPDGHFLETDADGWISSLNNARLTVPLGKKPPV